MIEPVTWILKPFERLTAPELYAVLRLRNEVFVVEQQCIYADTDDKDQQAFHLLGFHGEMLAAYARLFAPGKHFTEAAIGRIVTAPSRRRTGLGKMLMHKSIEIVRRMHGNVDIRIGAQCYLEKFYNAFGFQAAGASYLEDGIPHIEMLLPATKGEFE